MSLRIAARLSGCVLAGAVKVAIGLSGIDGPTPQEAPAGFNTPSFNGAQSGTENLRAQKECRPCLSCSDLPRT